MFTITPEILSENKRRNDVLFAPYDPIRGIGSPIERVAIDFGDEGIYHLPVSMLSNNTIKKAFDFGGLHLYLKKVKRLSVFKKYFENVMTLRLKHDFEFWAITCGKILSKPTEENPASDLIKFKLRLAQRVILKELEDMRINGVPIRMILLKCRQYGGSTVIDLYEVWLGLYHATNWNQVIVAQDDNAAKNIRSMFQTVADYYPEEIGSITLNPYRGSTKNLICAETGGLVSVGSIENPKQFRSYSYMMGHLSEVALWGETKYKNALELAQSLKASIPYVPLTMIAIESTAKGVGNFFHNEWKDAKKGIGGYAPVFIPWLIIDMYWKKIDDYDSWAVRLNNGFNRKDKAKEVLDYANFLWNIGATLEGINWYFWYKQKENASDQYMFEEYPSTPEEAFVSSGRRAFDMDYVNNARKTACEPEFVGDIEADASTGKDCLNNIRFKKQQNGLLEVWEMPDTELAVANRYEVIVDIGGKSKDADWTDILVLDRYWMMYGEGEKVVAEWHGHIDQDLASYKAAQIAFIYNKALLVVERNSLKVKDMETEGDHSMTVLDLIADFYPNLYARVEPDKLKDGVPPKYGFFTSVSTKPMVVDALNAALRDSSYEERSKAACDELDTYEVKQDGTYGAKVGCHDDRVMTRAIGIHISRSFMPPPREIKFERRKTKFMNEATM